LVGITIVGDAAASGSCKNQSYDHEIPIGMNFQIISRKVQSFGGYILTFSDPVDWFQWFWRSIWELDDRTVINRNMGKLEVLSNNV
jgi:hypothetical protein